MIASLHIKNVGIIEEININFNDGLSVITGETGAGKSLIIDALSIISGGRCQKDMIRNGKEFLLVEACIFSPNNIYAQDSNIIVSREVYLSGKNFCKINGRLVTVSMLKEFMKDIIDIHSQNDSQKLMEVSNHIEYLDLFCSKDIIDKKKHYNELYVKYIDINNELSEKFGDDKEKERTLDILEYQYNEIQNANLKIGEDERIESELKLIQNSEKIVTNLSKVENELSNNVINGFETSIRFLSKIGNIDEKYNKKLSSIESMYYDIQEILADITSYRDDINFDEITTKELTNRIDLIYSLKRKYGNSIEDIINYKLKVKEQIESINNLDEYIMKLKEELIIVKSDMKKIALEMSSIRDKYLQILTSKINDKLKKLEMKSAKFSVSKVVSQTEDYNINGLDKIEFMICTNEGEDKKPLCKIASGGELSRIMLAIKTVLAEVDKIDTVIFDEIDTGISGAASKAVSEELKNISKKHQVFCITHTAIIAASADNNYLVSKNVSNGKTRTSIKLLEINDTLKEIARISSGSVTDVAINYALELKKSLEGVVNIA